MTSPHQPSSLTENLATFRDEMMVMYPEHHATLSRLASDIHRLLIDFFASEPKQDFFVLQQGVCDLIETRFEADLKALPKEARASVTTFRSMMRSGLLNGDLQWGVDEELQKAPELRWHEKTVVLMDEADLSSGPEKITCLKEALLTCERAIELDDYNPKYYLQKAWIERKIAEDLEWKYKEQGGAGDDSAYKEHYKKTADAFFDSIVRFHIGHLEEEYRRRNMLLLTEKGLHDALSNSDDLPLTDPDTIEHLFLTNATYYFCQDGVWEILAETLLKSVKNPLDLREEGGLDAVFAASSAYAQCALRQKDGNRKFAHEYYKKALFYSLRYAYDVPKGKKRKANRTLQELLQQRLMYWDMMTSKDVRQWVHKTKRSFKGIGEV
ncbi:hypothetical protein COY07_06010 [Candidatus Peregrinibacteria bacterium CG_4_10_14_0_2_um_filter_43_11]|nr:MAG: hypothetical protein COY07_06010 [Candidatus Peregrinibacteria bacterium CG_4_10_14_0_2_um_filter_43_11]